MIKIKNIINESSPGYENRKFGDPLPTLADVAKRHNESKKEEVEEETVTEGVKTGWKLYKVYDISDKLWREMKYDLRDQFDELVKIGEDYGVFQNAQGTFKALKQIKRIMDKI